MIPSPKTPVNCWPRVKSAPGPSRNSMSWPSKSGETSGADRRGNLKSMFFRERYNLTPCDLERYLAEALSCGGEYADLYFEYVSTSSLSLDESLIKSATQGISVGCGVRVLSGEKTGYAYTDDLAPQRIAHAARVAAQIAAGPSQVHPVSVGNRTPAHDLYPIGDSALDGDLGAKLSLLSRADRAARAFDSRVFQVRAGYADEIR